MKVNVVTEIGMAQQHEIHVLLYSFGISRVYHQNLKRCFTVMHTVYNSRKFVMTDSGLNCKNRERINGVLEHFLKGFDSKYIQYVSVHVNFEFCSWAR